VSTTETTLGGRYRIGPLIAQGGMGTVYRGSDDVLGRDVAIKILDDELAGNPEFIERFRREARNAALLLHQNIAGIFDYGNDDGRWYIVMELVEGEDLAARLDREVRLPWREVAGLGAQVAAALGHAHARGVVHRDVKPANIVITPAGEAKVTDFGIALAFRSTTNLTATGSVVGTPS
jgi:serine/threonine protein kinase